MAIKAIQQIMLGTVASNEKKAKEILFEIKAAGYDGIELNSFMVNPTPFMVRVLTKAAGMPVGKGGGFDWEKLVKQAGLTVVGLHKDLGSIEIDAKKAALEAKKYGTSNIIITGMYRFDYKNRTAVSNLCRRLNEAGEKLKKEGINLLYHNHNYELQKLDGKETAFDYIINHTDPECVNFEFDSYWPTEAGVSAFDIMQKLNCRMKLYHINDRGTRLTKTAITPILKSDSVELGTGNMDLKKLVRYALSVHVEAVILESHKNWIDKSPIKSFELSAKFMNEHIV